MLSCDWFVLSSIPHKVMQDSTAAIQRRAHNYLTSGFNNIHLKCAQQNCMDTALIPGPTQNCMDTALILHCTLILGPTQNTGQ